MSQDPFETFARELDPETAQFLEQAAPLLDQMPAMETLTVEEVRRLGDERSLIPTDKLDHSRDVLAPGAEAEVPLRILSPKNPDGVYLYIHGGGWIGGYHDRQDIRLWAFAEEANVAVVSVGYRLAPEHPYPAPPDDCEAAALWTIENALAEFGTDRIVIGGESAGAHLSAVTVLRMRDRHGYAGFRGVELRYGIYDLRLTPSVRSGTMRALSGESIAWLVNHFVDEKLLEDPDVSPLFADLSGLPPALFTIGTEDCLVDDTLFMYARWRAAGNQAALRVYKGGLHAFDALPIAIGLSARSGFLEFISERVLS